MAQRALKDPRARRVIRGLVSYDPTRGSPPVSQVSQDSAGIDLPDPSPLDEEPLPTDPDFL